MPDTFWDEPGFSAHRSEMAFTHVKPQCELLLEAAAYAPGGKPTTHMRAGLNLGSRAKAIDVVGDRIWLSGPTGPRISDPEPFAQMPIRYDLAFGGVDRSNPDDAFPMAYPANLVGRG